jgi:hypothetical protein
VVDIAQIGNTQITAEYIKNYTVDSHQDARRTRRVDDSRRIFLRNKAKNGGVPEDRGCVFPSTNNPSHIGAHVD